MDLKSEEREVRAIVDRVRTWRVSFANEQEHLKKHEQELQRTLEAQDILQHLAQAVQHQAHQRISAVVSHCLAAVFDDPYEFNILFERKRGKTEATLQFVRRGMEADPLTAAGGGVVDVAAFALRIVCLSLHRPKLSRVLIMDEPFRFVSSQYQEPVRQMLEKLSKDMGVQLVFVTHNENLVTGKIIEVE